MLSIKQKALVKATVPALQQHGETVTRTFYRNLFEAHPELYNVFNPSNQRDGGQQRSLAAAVLAYAQHIENPQILGPMLERIASKHVSLDVRPEHYPIVGKYLLGAIKEVLGDAATSEILNAWSEAYQQLANLMTNSETKLANAHAIHPAAWSSFKPFLVQKKVSESEVMDSFYLVPSDESSLPPYRSGQYLSIKVHPPDFPYDQIRQYSLSCDSNGEYYRISVQREVAPSHASDAPAGLVSNYLHDSVREGDELDVHMPGGDFTLSRDDSPVVLLSGGSGITAVLSMLEHLASPAGGTRDVLFIHATRSRDRHAFGDHLRTLEKKRPGIRVLVLYEEASSDDREGQHYDALGRISAEFLNQHLSKESAHFYYCGPVGFMVAVDRSLDSLGVPLANRHSEAFGPDPSFATLEETLVLQPELVGQA